MNGRVVSSGSSPYRTACLNAAPPFSAALWRHRQKLWLKLPPVFSRSTIGKLEPSYVIRKFLDAQRIHNLTAYLQALHRQSLANADHTTLLLNCYTKLKDSSKLEEFIKVKPVKVIKQAMGEPLRTQRLSEMHLCLSRAVKARSTLMSRSPSRSCDRPDTTATLCSWPRSTCTMNGT